MTNDDRAETAYSAMEAFTPIVMGDRTFDELVALGTDGDGPDTLSDLICNLMHLANKNGWDAHKLAKQGISNFDFEVESECETCGETDGCDCSE